MASLLGCIAVHPAGPVRVKATHPETVSPTGLKFQVLSLQASPSLPLRLAFMPVSHLPSREEFAAEDVGAGPMAVMLNLLQRPGLAETCCLHGMNWYSLFLAAQGPGT